MKKYLLNLIFLGSIFMLSAEEMLPNLTKLYTDRSILKNEAITNFRSMQDPANYQMPINTHGLEKLKASGSSQFNEKGLQEIQERIGPGNLLIVVDLRDELHGILNGFPVHWKDIYHTPEEPISCKVEEIYEAEARWIDEARTTCSSIVRGYYNIPENDLNKSLQELREEIKSLLSPDWDANKVRIKYFSPDITTKLKIKLEINVNSAMTEMNICDSCGVAYFRIPVVDFYYPNDSEVNRFLMLVKAVKSGPENWLHFHCKAGKGRTTSFLAMYDMIHNAKEVSLEDILTRQEIMGGVNLIQEAKTPWAIARLEFLEAFYNYCRDNNDNFETPFTHKLDLLDVLD